MYYIRPLHLKQTHPRVHLWNLKSSIPNKQILQMLEPFDLLSILATHQWNKKINLNFFFLGLRVILEVYPNLSNLSTPIKSVNFGVSLTTKIKVSWDWQSYDLILLRSLKLSSSIYSSMVSTILTSRSFSIIGSSLFSSTIILILGSSSITRASLISSEISIFCSLTSK